MARSALYKVPFRRRREGRTDYRLRIKLIQSGLPRFIARGSLKHFIAQVVEAKVEGDRVVASTHSNELKRSFNWLGAYGNLPAAYLVGLSTGLKAVKLGVREAVADIGLHKPCVGSRVFAAIKGAIDGGLKIPCSSEVLPSEDRVCGEHIASYARRLAELNPSLYQKHFSLYLAKGLKPEALPEHFKKVREAIIDKYRGFNEAF